MSEPTPAELPQMFAQDGANEVQQAIISSIDESIRNDPIAARTAISHYVRYPEASKQTIEMINKRPGTLQMLGKIVLAEESKATREIQFDRTTQTVIDSDSSIKDAKKEIKKNSSDGPLKLRLRSIGLYASRLLIAQDRRPLEQVEIDISDSSAA